ncbi:hypothetical protein ACHAPJ_005253 [Fusarium lateritium]
MARRLPPLQTQLQQMWQQVMRLQQQQSTQQQIANRDRDQISHLHQRVEFLATQQQRMMGQQLAAQQQQMVGQQLAAQQQMANPVGNQIHQRIAPQMNNQVNQPVGHTRAIPPIPVMLPPVYLPIGKSHGDILTQGLNNMNPNDRPAVSQSALGSFQCACRNSTTSTARPVFHNPKPGVPSEDLKEALSKGQVNFARRLLANGAPIDATTPLCILLAPEDHQIPLFELLTQYGWTPNTPGHYGAVLLPSVVTNDMLLDWFLAHGADPNLGQQQIMTDIKGGSDTNSCQALSSAATQGSLSAVRKLLKAGAKVQNGTPLYFAVFRCPPNVNALATHVTQSKPFDKAQIPIMALLVENGADVNKGLQTRQMSPKYPIVVAVMAGAVERAKWLLSQGADPHLKGAYGSASEYVRKHGSAEMKRVFGMAAK